jgi:hypothetical protein
VIRATEDYSLCNRFIPTSCDHGHGRPYNKLCLFPCHGIRATEDYSLCIMFIPKLCDQGHGGPYNKYHVYSHVMRSGPQRTIHCVLCLFPRLAITATEDHTIKCYVYSHVIWSRHQKTDHALCIMFIYG